MRPEDFPKFDRVPTALVEAFRPIGAATAHEAQGRTGALSASIKPVKRHGRICGPAFTLRLAPGDNLGLHFAIAAAQKGDVIVVDAHDAIEHGPFGGILALTAQVRGLEGLVTSGSVRDVQQIEELGFPTFCKGVSIKGTTKNLVPEVGLAVVIDGVTIAPGDLVLGDADGVVIVPQNAASPVLEKSRNRDLSELAAMAQVRSGTLPWEILKLEAALQGLLKV